jgi:hypothetical protein
MELFIANCTKQTFRHCYRQPESERTGMLDIPSGQQRAIGKGWSKEQFDAVISHLESFGALPVKDLSRNMTDFDGILYSLGTPVPSEKILEAHDVVVDHQEKRSATEATRSALAFDAAGRDKKRGNKRLASVSEVEVVQDVPARQQPTGAEVNFKVSVANDGRTDVKLPL